MLSDFNGSKDFGDYGFVLVKDGGIVSDQFSEIAIAAAESAKFGTKAVEEASKLISFLGLVFKEPIELASGVMGDRLKFVRWKRQIRLADEVQKIISARGLLVTRAVPPKFALPLIEQASLEDSDELQNLWSRLLANAMDPKKQEIKMSYIEILKNLTSLDAKIIQELYTSVISRPEMQLESIGMLRFTKEQIKREQGIDELEYLRSANNLMRVMCITPAVLRGDVTFGQETLTFHKGTDEFVMTILGYDLVSAISD